jgi:hypothetical protein
MTDTLKPAELDLEALKSFRGLLYSAFPADAGLGRSHDWRFGGRYMSTLPAQPRRASAQDLFGSVHVGVVGVVTMDADEDRLALAASGIHHTAGRARLRGVSGRNGDQHPAAFGKLVLQEGRELAPALLDDRAVEASLLTDVAPRPFDRALRARRHAGDLEVFDGDEAEAPGNVGGRQMAPVSANAGRAGAQSRHAGLLARPAGRSSFASRQDLLSPRTSPIDSDRTGDVDGVASGQSKRLRDPAVDPNAREAADLYFALNLLAEGYAPSARAARHGYAKTTASHWAGVPEFDPADLRQPDGAPLGAQALEIDVDTPQAEGVVHPEAARSWEPGATREEGAKSRVKISDGLVQRVTRHSCYPINFGAKRGDLAALLRPTKGAPYLSRELAPEVTALLQTEVVDEPHCADPLAQGLGLRRGRVEVVAIAAMQHAAKLAQRSNANQRAALSPGSGEEG